jgi:predicted dinucleotide-binding enzyme
MKIAVLGTGTVGQVLASKLVALGHSVTLGSRTADNDEGLAWAASSGGALATFEQAAAASELVINAVSGQHSLAALEAAGRRNLAGKVLIDVANPLDFSKGFPPTLSVCGDDPAAKAQVAELLQSFGWRRAQLLDLGGLSQARGTEAWLLMWTRVYGALGTPLFNLVLARGEA